MLMEFRRMVRERFWDVDRLRMYPRVRDDEMAVSRHVMDLRMSNLWDIGVDGSLGDV